MGVLGANPGDIAGITRAIGGENRKVGIKEECCIGTGKRARGIFLNTIG